MFTWPSLVTVAALFTYFIFIMKVGLVRAKCGIKPPQMTGDPELERTLRVQENTLEQMILFIPCLWLFSWYINPLWGAGLGAVWVIGRVFYAWGYYQAAEKRLLGFGIATSTTIVLLLGSLIGVVRALI